MTSQQPKERAEILRFPFDPSNARDELNLCEFPLAVLSDRTPKDLLELTFNDTLWDESERKEIGRTLHVSAPPKYGLPTAKDEEVLLALIHLTDQVNQFTDRTVHFSRYELIKLLGWNDGGKSYQRITESLRRWKSVTLDYRNAWRDHRAKSWVSEVFSIIDNVTFYEAEKNGRDDNRSGEQIHLPLSQFVWNRVFFESMQAKYFKRLDFSFYQRLQTPTAKRLFRFLDKRFGSGRSYWEFDLHEFAFEHIGLSRNYDTGKIKEKILPAINELEREGYLQPLPKERRFEKSGKSWRIRFSKATESRPIQSPPNDSDLIGLLTKRGVSPKAAADLTASFDAEHVQDQVNVFDWIMERHKDSIKNPGGFLAESIRSGFKPPAGYVTKEQTEQAAERRVAHAESRQQAALEKRREQQMLQQQRDHLATMRASLSPAQLGELEQEAIDDADDTQRESLNNPTFRDFQIELLMDELILQRFPLIDECGESDVCSLKSVSET